MWLGERLRGGAARQAVSHRRITTLVLPFRRVSGYAQPSRQPAFSWRDLAAVKSPRREGTTMRPPVDDRAVRILRENVPEFEDHYLDLLDIYDEDLTPQVVFNELADFVTELHAAR